MKKIISVLFCFAAVLLMVSSATAVPVKNAEPIAELVEEQEQYNEIIEEINYILTSDLKKDEKYQSFQEVICDSKLPEKAYVIMAYVLTAFYIPLFIAGVIHLGMVAPILLIFLYIVVYIVNFLFLVFAYVGDGDIRLRAAFFTLLWPVILAWYAGGVTMFGIHILIEGALP